MKDLSCSIIIATRNEEKYIGLCLKSLENQSYENSRYEIIIVDGKSQDDTLNIIAELKSKYNNIILLDNPHKIAPCAFNAGINISRGKYIFIAGAHTEYPYDFIEKSIDSLEKNKVDCVGGREIDVGRGKIGRIFAAVRNTPFGGGLSPYRYSDKKQLVETVAYGCYTKEILSKIGGFNESLVRNHDNDLNKRIIQAGGRILFEPEIKFYYYTRNSLKEIFHQMFGYGFWEAKLIKKQRNQLSFVTLVPMFFVLYTIAAFILLLIKGMAIPLILELVTYLSVFSYFAIEAFIPKRHNILIALFLYLLIHFSIGIGFIAGLVETWER